MHLLLSTLLAFNFSLAMAKENGNTVPKMEAAQKQLRERIRTMIKGSTCSAKNECDVLMMGNAGGCGNPDTFWAYNPTKVEKDKITLLVKSERQLASKIQREKSKGQEAMMGACGFSPPQALCTKGLCVIDSSKKKYQRQ